MARINGSYYGNDTVKGGRDDDFLHGGFGNNVLFGDAGDDFLSSRDGNDTLYG